LIYQYVLLEPFLSSNLPSGRSKCRDGNGGCNKIYCSATLKTAWNKMNSNIQVIWKLSTLCILVVNHFFLFQPNTHNKYIYLSPVTSYTFWCLLHHLQEDYCVTCLKTMCFMQEVLLAQKLYACCREHYLLKNYMLYARSVTCSKTVCLLQRALLA